MNIPHWLRKILGLPDPSLVDPTVADLQARLAAAEAAAAASRLHAMDATRQLQQSVPVSLSPGVATPTANVATAPNPPAPPLAAADAGNVTTADKAVPAAQNDAGSTQTAADVSSSQAAAPSAPAAPLTQGEAMPAMPPITDVNTLRDVLFLRASSAYASPAYARAQAALGASLNWYINAYGAGGDYYNALERTGSYISVWVPSWHCIGIGGMNQAMFESIKPEIAALGSPPLA